MNAYLPKVILICMYLRILYHMPTHLCQEIIELQRLLLAETNYVIFIVYNPAEHGQTFYKDKK